MRLTNVCSHWNNVQMSYAACHSYRCIFGSATLKNCNIFAGNINHSIADQITHHLLTDLYTYHLVVRLSTCMQVCLVCGRTSETTVKKWHQSTILFMRQWKLQNEYEQPTQQQWMWGWLWVMNLEYGKKGLSHIYKVLSQRMLGTMSHNHDKLHSR